MFESLIITLREGIEAALAIGIIMVYLRRQGRTHLVRFVAAGLWCAVAASLVAALGIQRLDLSGELAEGVIMLAAAALVVSMLVWMARHARKLKGEIERKVEAASAGGDRLAGAALFGLAFLLVFREGAETVLLLAAVSFESDALLSFLGGLAGLGIALLFYVAFVRGSLLVDLGRFFKVTGAVLVIFALQLVLGGIHELGEAGVIPLGRAEMRTLGPIVKGETLFLAALLTLPLIVMLIPGTLPKRTEAAGAAAAPGADLSAPERRRALAILLVRKRWRAIALGLGFIVAVSLTAAHTYSRLPRAIDPPVMVEPVDGEVRVPVAGLDDGHLHRFGVRVAGTVVRFFIMQAEAGRLATAFDACEVCGADGYVEEKGRLTCITCAADIVRTTVGRGGGCNPIPLPSRQEAGEVRIELADLERLTAAFRTAEAARSAPPAR
ncbi:MAG TPA: Fe-S-containing protein [Candidatus Polarisedimenticolia bacterium]|jgi:FTR1 family protein